MFDSRIFSGREQIITAMTKEWQLKKKQDNDRDSTDGEFIIINKDVFSPIQSPSPLRNKFRSPKRQFTPILRVKNQMT
jgi:hypothetical protein